MQIIECEVEKLKLYKKNPRYNKNSITLVAESIKEFGFKVPIIVDDKYEIIAGHTRLEASKLLGLKKVPIIKVDDLTDEQVRAFRLADNKVAEMAEWDENKLEQEIKNIKDVNLELLGFINTGVEDINWDDIDEISEENYEEPEHKMFECPYCNHVDRADHFKKNKVLNMSDVI